MTNDSDSSGSKVKEEKYLVLKLDDIEKYLTDREKFALTNVCLRIREGRDLDGKKQNHYVVVNEEETYAEKVWDLILGRDHEAYFR